MSLLSRQLPLLTPAARVAGQWAACRFARGLATKEVGRSSRLRVPKVPMAWGLARNLGYQEADASLKLLSAMRARGMQQRGIVHVPAVVWGAGKLGAIVSGVLSKKYAAGILAKWLMDLGAVNVLKALREANDGLLASGVHNKDAYEKVNTSIASLEAKLLSVAKSERLRILQEWLSDAESKAPRLVVALGHAYADSFKSVKMAKSLVKGVDSGSPKEPDTVGGLTPTAWERKIHETFPELQSYRIAFTPKEEEEELKK